MSLLVKPCRTEVKLLTFSINKFKKTLTTIGNAFSVRTLPLPLPLLLLTTTGPLFYPKWLAAESWS
jgi:hypothetical protein